MADHIELGKEGEIIAVDYLQKKGFQILARNFRFKRAEVDIIVFKNDLLRIVEVKTRLLGDLLCLQTCGLSLPQSPPTSSDLNTILHPLLISVNPPTIYLSYLSPALSLACRHVRQECEDPPRHPHDDNALNRD